MYLPTLVQYIIRRMKLLPLWSAIMVPIYGYGDETSSLAAVESSFKKLKTITFKQDNLPILIEDFLPRHISSLKEIYLIHPTKNSLAPNSNDDINRQSYINSQTDDKEDTEIRQYLEEVENTTILSE